MTQPAPPPNGQAVAGLATVVASASTAAGVAAALSALAGVSSAVALALVSQPGMATLPATLAVWAPAVAQTRASEATWRSAFLIAASQRVRDRIATGMSLHDAVEAETGNMRAHLAAQANRMRAAMTADKAAAKHGLMLGWRAVMDDRTSAECRRANGKNFPVTSRPLIGWPGSVHPHCRCRPVAPFVGAGLVDDVATATERKVAVA